MDITHKTRRHELKGSGSELFLLENKKGGYALLGQPDYSHFGGVFFFLPDDWTLFKTIENIFIDAKPQGLRNKFFAVDRYAGATAESFFFFGKTFYYEVTDYSGSITLDLDMRRVYDNPQLGRSYRLYYEQDALIIEYYFKEETFFLVIKGASNYTVLDEWLPRHYAYDAKRGSLADRHVYRALRFFCDKKQRLSFTFGTDKHQALLDADNAFDEWDLMRSRVQQFAHSVKTDDSVPLSSAVFALESLVSSFNGNINRTGVFAGFPWFFQFWSRDELISLHGLVLAEKYSLVKDILLRYADNIGVDGRLPNRLPSADLGSADAVGWLWKRLGDFLLHLENKKLVWEYFSVAELNHLSEQLEYSLRLIQKNYVSEDLVVNGPKETWMDTHGGSGDMRAGNRVEVQALTLASLKTLFLLYRLLKKTNGNEFRSFERSLLTAVRKVLVVDDVLADGFSGGLDKTIRPNIFLAYYLCPELLTKKQWIKTFDFVLPALWLDWGGLASISKDNPLFCAEYSGENNKSYHRGDSWYWVNNYAALALFAVDAERYNVYISKIQDASIRDLLWIGVIGQCSEISSATKQSAAGCFAQAWSAASLVELLYGLKK
jgi:predicted glycogen debranching enzyme